MAARKAARRQALRQLSWYLDSAFVTAPATRAITARWDSASVQAIATAKPSLVAKLAKTLPHAGPTDLFGAQAKLLYPLALRDVAIRKWCTVNADPRELLALVTQAPGSIAKLWRGIVADGVDAEWYKGLGTGIGAENDTRLRTLVLSCPDAAAVAWMRTALIGDHHIEADGIQAGRAVRTDAYEIDAYKRLQQGVADDEVSDTGERTNELSDVEIARLRANPDELAAILPQMNAKWLVRNLLRIEPQLPIVLKHAAVHADTLPAYVRTRPAEETIDAFADDAIEAAIRRWVQTPFIVLPALREAPVLAAVLKRSSTLTWLLRTTDAPYVMTLFAEPKVGKAAAKLFTAEHLALMPDMVMSKPQRDTVTKFAAMLDDEDLAEGLRERAIDPADLGVEENDAGDRTLEKAKRNSFDRIDVQARQDELEAALGKPDLAHALDLVLTDPVSLANVLAVCRERASGAAVLVGKIEHEKRVAALSRAVDASPIGLFPNIPYQAYFHTAESRKWLFHHEPADALFREIATDPVMTRMVIEKIDAADPGIAAWLANMPKGSALNTFERRTAKRLFAETTTVYAARKLFELRFGAEVGKSFDKVELGRLWEMLELVPDAHIEMGSVVAFAESDQYLGVYGKGAHWIGLQEGLLRKPIEDKSDSMFDQNLQLTRAQLTAAYGYNEAQLAARIAAKEIDEINTAAGTRYVIKPVPASILDTTLLHEIGHAVDDMLGNQTELVYGLAGWKAFTERQIEELAVELGNWNRVAAADQARIKDAWLVWLNAKTSATLDTFVPKDHPAVAENYKGVGIVDLALTKQFPGAQLTPRAGKLTIVNPKYQLFYRVPERTRNAAPSMYSMTAPEEYFAECYAEYYREYRGPGTEDKKGGKLAEWIKDWFTQNIDNLKHNPSRRDQ